MTDLILLTFISAAGGFTLGLFAGVELVLSGLRRLGLYAEFRKRQKEEDQIDAHSN